MNLKEIPVHNSDIKLAKFVTRKKILIFNYALFLIALASFKYDSLMFIRSVSSGCQNGNLVSSIERSSDPSVVITY
jgi:hypothetical protein